MRKLTKLNAWLQEYELALTVASFTRGKVLQVDHWVASESEKRGSEERGYIEGTTQILKKHQLEIAIE